MKKCPVCGVMMGDNVARCFMCKYDFQKASREGEDVARKEAEENVKKNEMEVSARVSEKKAEEERRIEQIKEQSRVEIEAIQRQLEEERLRLEQEYVEVRKRSLEDRTRLDKDLSIVRAEIEKEKKVLADTTAMRDAAERAAIKGLKELLRNISIWRRRRLSSFSKQQMLRLRLWLFRSKRNTTKQ